MYPRNDFNIVHCFERTTDFDNRLWFQWTDNAIWIWTAAPNYSTKIERPEAAAQSIQHLRYNGGSKPCRMWLWQELQTTITAAFRTVTDVDAPDEHQRNWRIGDASHDDVWYYNQLRWWTSVKFFLPSTPTPPPPPRKLKRKLSLGMSFPKRGGVSQHVCEACAQLLL